MLKYSINIDIRFVLLCTASLLTLAVTAGCTATEDDQKLPTQVAARVNGDEITVHQINYVLEQNQNVTPDAADEAKRKILDRLIHRQLARQKAVEHELDRSPRVMRAIESAKSEILARAYLEQLATSLPEPQPWEIEKYYSEHPELFAQRRLFEIEEFVFVAKDGLVPKLRAQLSAGRSMPEIANWLRSQGINFVANYGRRTAEQTSLDILPNVQAMNAGQIQLFDSGGGRLRVIHLVDFKSDPLDEATATPRIRQFLMNRRSSEIIAREMNDLEDQANIEYLGEFAGDKSAPEAQVEAESGGEAESERNTQAR